MKKIILTAIVISSLAVVSNAMASGATKAKQQAVVETVDVTDNTSDQVVEASNTEPAEATMMEKAIDATKRAGSATMTKAGELTQGAKTMGGNAVDATKRTGGAVKDKAGSLTEGVKGILVKAVEATKNAGGVVKEKAGSAYEATKKAGSSMMNKSETPDASTTN